MSGLLRHRLCINLARDLYIELGEEKFPDTRFGSGSKAAFKSATLSPLAEDSLIESLHYVTQRSLRWSLIWSSSEAELRLGDHLHSMPAVFVS